MFEAIRDAPSTENWLCHRSLSLAHYPTKRRAENDFVLLTHHRIFIPECKGGRQKSPRGHLVLR